MAPQYDLVIIGSGPGGYRAAILGRLRGLEVAIVEKADWGGCCLNRGCVPKKDWHHTARLLSASRDFTARGINGGPLTGDLDAAWDHQKSVVTSVRDNYTDYMKRLGITALRGSGRLADSHSVVVAGEEGETTVTAAHIVLATGSAPHVPDGITPDGTRILTTDDLFDRRPPPGRRVALAGGGVIGTEFAYILTRLGCDLSWFLGGKPLRGSAFTPAALRTLGEALEREGVTPQAGRRLSGAVADGDGVTVTLSDDSSERFDWLLLGTGRVPYTEGLGLEVAGVTTDEGGFIQVDAALRTGQPNIFAIGDCRGAAMTANQALADATTVVDNIITGGERPAPDRWVPMAIYSAVEMARAGLDDDTAEDEGHEPAVGFAAFESSPRALGQDEPEGHVRLLADRDDGTLLGVEVVGDDAAETIHLTALAPDPGQVLHALAGGPWNHPTRAEEFGNAAETMASQWDMDEFIFGKRDD